MGPSLAPRPMAIPFSLRPYQADMVEKIRTELRRKERRVLSVLSTGGGKTVIFTYMVAAATAKGKRVIIVAHRKEICQQISRALDIMGVQHGLIMPGKTRTNDLVQVAMVQTLAIRLKKGTIDEPDILVIDEAHHAVAGSWDKVTAGWKKALIIGVTATPQRLDGKGLRDAFDVIVLGPTMAELIEQGHLAAYEYLAPPSSLDLSHVKTRGGDYAIDELEEAMAASTIVGDAVEHYAKTLNGRPAIAFCVTRAHARAVAAQFAAAGWKSESIDGSMSAEVRADLIADLADGRINVLTSCELISEGVDVPVCAGAILLRPTKSLSMFLQQIGRALRPKPDGSAAVILDHVGNVHRFGMPDSDRDWSLDGKAGKKKADDITVCELCFKTFAKSCASRIGALCKGLDGDPCPYSPDERESQKSPPMVVDGELQVVTNIRPAEQRPAWARGLRIDKDPEAKQGNKRDWHRLLELADTREKLEEIREARGYKAGWVDHVLRTRAETKAAVDAILWGSVEHNQDPNTWNLASDSVLWGIIKAVNAAERSDEGYPSYWPNLETYARMELAERRSRRVVA